MLTLTLSHHIRFRGLIGMAGGFLTAMLVSSASAQNTAIKLSDPLQPEQIILLYNPAEAGTRELAEFYAARRKVPKENICPVSLPLGDDLSREKYDRELVPTVKGFVEKRMREGVRVRGLLSMYGMPLRIGGPVIKPEWKARAKEVNDLLQAVAGDLDRDIQTLEELGTVNQSQPASRPTTQKAPAIGFENFDQWMQRYQTAAQKAMKRIQAAKEPAKQAELESAFLAVLRRNEGLGRLLGSLQVRNPATTQAVQELETAIEKFLASKKEVEILLSEPPFADSRLKGYQMLREIGGNLVLARQLLEDRILMSGEQQQANLEGELAILMWPKDYTLVRWLPNPLLVGFTTGNVFKTPRTTLLAVRLDGPDLATVRQRLADAWATEKKGLEGTVYVDARGIKNGSAYGEYDQNLRELAQFLKEHGKLKTVLDDKPEVFPPGSCPDAALYCGWYSLAKYVDSFAWVQGAVGYHIASSEAVKIRGECPFWVSQMLKRGVVASVGPVNEPYLASFPLPTQFFSLLMTGKFTFAEVYYATAPMVSWMQTPVGDPLYRPFAAKPAVEWSELEKVWPQVKTLTESATTQPVGKP